MKHLAVVEWEEYPPLQDSGYSGKRKQRQWTAWGRWEANELQVGADPHGR